MNEAHIQRISDELNLQRQQVVATSRLLADGGTVPFIARYRKEATGSLDEVAITAIRDRLGQLAELDSRREAIIKSLDERKLLTPVLNKAIQAAETLTRLEDIYLPYRPKRRTRATIAREKGLEPLAQYIFEHQHTDPTAEADKYVDPAKEIENVDAALAGARDILAETMNDDADVRAAMRTLYFEQSVLSSAVITTKEAAGAKYRDYFDWQEPISKAPSHRILAIRRGEKEGFLYTRAQPDEALAKAILQRTFVKGQGKGAEQVSMAAEDCYKRLLGPSLETETRMHYKKQSDQAAVRVFADNLRELLLASPLGQKRVMAIDPGFRTGCKVVCLDAQGKLLFNDVIYLEQSQHLAQQAADKVMALCQRFAIEAIAIGNGTASRETETFVRGLPLPAAMAVVMVNESGASIYSASEIAREEFPDQDITVRGAVSIGRRLMDPLAELVKIDPKSIGVGQYQHDVSQTLLKKSLDDVVVSCVNAVGVEVNTASKQLLSYVAGLNETIAGNIVAYRNENGPFRSREELSKVPRLGPKAYEQAAGFLRIRDAANPLDCSSVHPESYGVVEQIAQRVDCTVQDLVKNASLQRKINIEDFVSEQVGLPTLRDIVAELAKPGRDPREQFEVFQFAKGVATMTDLQLGMKVPGLVTNVTAFGAFVDVGVHQDGLVHISQLSDSFVEDPAKVVKVGQKVQVTVTEVDIERKRIGLSMKTNPELAAQRSVAATSNRANSGNSKHGSSQKGRVANGHRFPKHRQENRSADNGLRDDWFSQALSKGRR